MTDLIPAFAEDEAGLPGPRIGESVRREGERQLFRALAHREFRLLFAAYSIGDLGFWISHITLQSEMARVTDKSPLWLGFLFFATFIPMLLFAPPAGVLADRVDRKRLLITTRCLVAAAAGVLAACLHAGFEGPGMLAGFGFVLGTLFAFMAPAQQAMTANAVPNDSLASAISLQAAGNNVLRVGGPALAAPILAAWGAGWAFTAYAATNVVTILMLVPIRVSRRRGEIDTSSGWQQWKDGLRHARERRPAVAVLTTMAVLSIFGIAYVALYPVFATDVLGHPRKDFTWLVVASGSGAFFGVLAIGLRRRSPTLRTALAWLVGFAIAAGGFALSRSWELSLAFNALVGLCYFSVTTSLNTVLQQLADDDKRGRLLGLFTLTWAGLIPIGGIWMGVIADIGGAPLALQIGAAVCLVYAVTALTRYETVPPR
ncbi:MAG: MFS transporter [Acidimicrobiia bacterium]